MDEVKEDYNEVNNNKVVIMTGGSVSIRDIEEAINAIGTKYVVIDSLTEFQDRLIELEAISWGKEYKHYHNHKSAKDGIARLRRKHQYRG